MTNGMISRMIAALFGFAGPLGPDIPKHYSFKSRGPRASNKATAKKRNKAWACGRC